MRVSIMSSVKTQARMLALVRSPVARERSPKKSLSLSCEVTLPFLMMSALPRVMK